MVQHMKSMEKPGCKIEATITGIGHNPKWIAVGGKPQKTIAVLNGVKETINKNPPTTGDIEKIRSVNPSMSPADACKKALQTRVSIAFQSIMGLKSAPSPETVDINNLARTLEMALKRQPRFPGNG
jgi:hypothetical protein